MDDKPVLQVNMLGGCSLRYGENTIDDVNYHAKKPWVLLEYLIAFRSREIPMEELLGLLYPGEQGAKPLGALKTLVYRARELLDGLGLPDSRDRILMTRGSYAWNTSIPMVFDADCFELACQRAASPRLLPEEKLETCLAAAALYKGDFLARSPGESWVAGLAAYYHSMYKHLVRSAVELLMARGQWEDMAQLCARAIEIDSYEESFHFYLVRALAKTGQIDRALEHYRQMYGRFYTELGAPPPAELAGLYRELLQERAQSVQSGPSDLASASRFLLEGGRTAGALFCALEVFQEIYNMEARAVTRCRRGVYLAMLSAEMRDGTAPPLKLLNSYMDKLGECIRTTLRRGDVAAKYSDSQYILLLPTASAESGRLALSRVTGRFMEKYPRCPLLLRPSIREVDPVPASSSQE